MHICPRCKEGLPATEPDRSRPFPAFTVAGGILGAAAGVLGGPLLLVPAAIVMGAAVDVQRCGICGNPIGDDEQGYRLMNEVDDGLGPSSYRPVPDRSPSADFAGSLLSSGRSQITRPKTIDAASASTPFAQDLPHPQDRKPATDFTFDEIRGAFVPREPLPGSESSPAPGFPGEASEPDKPGGVESLAPLLHDPLFEDPFFDLGDLQGSDWAIPDMDAAPPTEEPPL